MQLLHHQNLRSPTQDSIVGGAEGGARVEGEEEIVQKVGRPGIGGRVAKVNLGEQEAFANMPFPAPGREVREAGACSRDHLVDDLVVCHGRLAAN